MIERPNSIDVQADKPARSKRSDSSQMLALLEQLQACLRASQTAMLAHDLAGIERGTLEQKQLQLALKDFLPHVLARRHPVSSQPPQPNSSCSAALGRAAERVLHLGRVQLGLVRRAERSLHVMAQLIAGAGANYTLIPGTNAISRVPSEEMRTKPCQV